MRRLTIWFSLIASGLLWVTAGAFMQSGSRTPNAGAPNSQDPIIANRLPQTYLNPTQRHKLLIQERDREVYRRLAQAGAIRQEVDYGSYKLVVIDEDAAGGRSAILALPMPPRDDQNLIILNGYLIDTGRAQPLLQELPADLRQPRLTASPAGAPGPGLYLVQFVGPIREGWLTILEETGVRVISYVPNNAYLVSADERAAGELVKLKNGRPFVEWLGDYEAAYKLAPGLQTARQGDGSQPVRVTVQLIDSAEGERRAEELRLSARRSFGERRVLKYRNLRIQVPVSQLAELARLDEVVAIEEDSEMKLLDEAQGQIVAGNLSGNAPSGPGYLDWLASKGFNGSQFGSFAINVVDDGSSLSGHPDLPDSRIAFENNIANLDGPRGNHGFLNAHIIGGFNDGTGPGYEDARGFNYGLGIVPWARIGATAIFPCPGSFLPTNPTVWEESAYDRRARISSNSWGSNAPYYTTVAQEYDSLVRDAQPETPGDQELTIVFAAGNSGPINGSVSAPGTAKNVITVGASESVRQTEAEQCGTNAAADSTNDIAEFSSRGPVNPFGGDGRVKPDLVAPGTRILAGIPQSNFNDCGICNRDYPPGQTLYGWSSGTSHSTPAVAGGAALVYQDFLNRGPAAPSPALLKALLMNSASYLTGEGANDTLPSNSQGLGLMNLGRVFDGHPRALVDQSRVFGASGEIYQMTGSIAASSEPFRVTLAWTDAPGASFAAPWVNNLDLEVTIGGRTYLGNVFSGASSMTGGAADGRNNVESVFLPAGVSGDFLITVRATNIAGDAVPENNDPTDQDFALVVYNGNPTPPTAPIIEVKPLSLSFTAVLGGPNPADQTININNTGIDTLNWTATADAPWLTVTPGGGAAPSTPAVSANIALLPAGIHEGTISIRSDHALNSPVSLPVKLTIVPRAFEVSPSALNFSASFGGNNPAPQPISIVNSVNSLRGWTASADAAWLSLSPASGTAPATLLVAPGIEGLPVGFHTGTITIRSTVSAVPPVQVPVTLTVNQLLSGGFEGPAGAWILSGATMRSRGVYPFQGSSYLLLGGANASHGSVYQQTALPRDSSLSLAFWLNIDSGDSTAANDQLVVEVRDRAGRLLSTLATFSNLNGSVPGRYTRQGPYSLAAFAGQTVRVQFRSTTDSSIVTYFRIDEVAVR
ncbi:MAG TPA: S8 family serine peptidase [Blastocatellia bacterium]|nr:S8 family serine peptidase [Blastocatellia bacterium]